MRASAAGILLFLLASGFAGCLTGEDGPHATPGPSSPQYEPLTWRLKPMHALSQLKPSASAPQKVYAYPTLNAYTNEDVEIFASPQLAGGLAVRNASLEIHYGVDRPTADAQGNGTSVGETRHFVFWIGSGGIYPSFGTVWGPPVLQPGTAYVRRIQFPLPAGGWNVPPGESLQLLVAPLAAQEGPDNLHYLIDHASTDSRLVLDAAPWTPAPVKEYENRSETQNVAGNSGMFTGLGPAAVSTIERPLEVRADDAELRIEARLQSTSGGKSDLDMTLRDSSGTTVASSTTPYQSETLRLYGAQIHALRPGTYTIHVDAYSGLDTTFDLVVRRAHLA